MRRRATRGLAALVAAGLLVLGACREMLVAPETAGVAPLAISLSLGAAARAAGGDAAAFDRADRIRIRVTGSGVVFADTVLAFSREGEQTTVRLALARPPADFPAQIGVELRLGDAPLFRGEGTAVLQPGAATPVQITLEPVVARIRLASPVATLTSLGESARLQGAALFATGDTVRGAVLVWRTLSPAVLEVAGDGAAVSRAEGEARVVATVGALADTGVVRVDVRTARVAIVPAAAELFVDSTLQLRAEVRDARGNLLPRPVAWTVGNATVATVDANGVVRGMAPGTATVFALRDGVVDSARITVRRVPVASVAIEPRDPSVIVGSTLQLSATTRDATGRVLSGREVLWQSLNPLVASVDALGRVRGTSVGSARIVATSEGVADTVVFTVRPVPVAAVTIAPHQPRLEAGQQLALSVATRDAAGNFLSGREVVWQSLDPEVATVDAEGIVVGRDAGTARIVATSEGIADTVVVTVLPVSVASVRIAPRDTTILVEQAVVFTAAVRDAGANALTGRVVEWRVSDTRIASVEPGGRLVALAPGTVRLFANVEGVVDSVTVTVTAPTADFNGIWEGTWYLETNSGYRGYAVIGIQQRGDVVALWRFLADEQQVTLISDEVGATVVGRGLDTGIVVPCGSFPNCRMTLTINAERTRVTGRIDIDFGGSESDALILDLVPSTSADRLPADASARRGRTPPRPTPARGPGR